ncbi:MAG TPA: methyltransferase domain-containing protein [Roseiflexaceae bacterium]|nr:methyltransferase domain-containing protein [Roseiflexaceae bacterium]
MSKRRELFEHWAASYEQAVHDQEEFPFAGYDRVLDTVVERSECQPDMAVLDLGTGTGNLAGRFAVCGCRVLATDFAEAMLEQTRHKLPGIETQTLDLLAASWPGGASTASSPPMCCTSSRWSAPAPCCVAWPMTTWCRAGGSSSAISRLTRF